MKKNHNRLFFVSLIILILLSLVSLPAFSASYSLTVNAGQEEGTWDRFYEMCVSSCHAYTVLDTAFGRNIQNSLVRGHDEAGFRYIRFHGILNADVGVYTEDNGNPVYNWTNFDRIFDAIKNAGMRPVLEISFTPPDLASGDTAIHWYNEVPANITMPKDWDKWMALISELVLHCEQRYGVEEVRNNWYFEVWNEPDWMLEGGICLLHI